MQLHGENLVILVHFVAFLMANFCSTRSLMVGIARNECTRHGLQASTFYSAFAPSPSFRAFQTELAEEEIMHPSFMHCSLS